MEENNQQEPLKEKTIQQEMEEEVKKQSEDNSEKKSEEEYVDLTDSEVVEEKKFQEVMKTSESLDQQEKPIEVPRVEFKIETPTTQETPQEIPTETNQVIKDQDLIFLQYQCDNCEFKIYMNNAEEDKGDNLKCYNCGKKKMNKKRLFDVTIKQFKEYKE